MRIRLAVTNGEIVDVMVVNGADEARIHHLLEIIRERIVMAGVVILGSNVVPGNYIAGKS